MPVFYKFVVVISLLMGLVFSCRSPESEDGFYSEPSVELDLAAIKKRGYINALVDNNSISYFIYKGKPMGYEYELLQLLAQHLNVTLKLKVTSGIQNAIEQLNKGEGDIIAFPLTVNKPRKQWVDFTRVHFNTYQVLVQRKPKNWRALSQEQTNAQLIRNPMSLDGKTIHVISGTSYAMRMRNLEEELGAEFTIVEDTTESEALIKKVATGEIDYTVSDHMIAQVNAAYYPNLDVNTVLSISQQIAWAVRKNSPQLLSTINAWLTQIKREPTFMVIYNRYFKSPRTSLIRSKSDYFSFGGNRLSPYDEIIKTGAKKLEWDWRLLAALVYQESKFNPQGESWAGARGLMQLMPETAKRFGANNVNDPAQSVKAGVNYLKYLDRFWQKSVADSTERLKFILASYNAGLSHIIDAQKLTRKHDGNPGVWEGNVEFYLSKKSEAKYYKDPVVTAGYCKCEEPVNYVRDVIDRYEEYAQHIQLQPEDFVTTAVTTSP